MSSRADNPLGHAHRRHVVEATSSSGLCLEVDVC